MSTGQFYGNVFFLGVARMAAEKALVVASYSYKTETDLGGVQQVLEQPNMNMSPGKHYTFFVGRVAWHLIADDMGLIYILICELNYPQRTAHACLEELQRSFASKLGGKASTAKERSLDKTCSSMLQTLCRTYDDLASVDKLAAVTKKVDSVKLVMQENVDIALQNCVKLETIEKASAELQQGAGVFRRTASELKNKMWWKNMKMKLIIAFVILAIIGIIVGIAVAMSKSN